MVEIESPVNKYIDTYISNYVKPFRNFIPSKYIINIDGLAGFFFAIRTPYSTYLTDGGFGFKNSSNSFDITYPGGGSVLASGIPSADVTGKDFRFTFTVSRAGDTISAASRLILGDKEYSYVKNAVLTNTAISEGIIRRLVMPCSVFL